MDAREAKRIAMKVSVNTVILNTILAAGKLAAGIFAHSGAMVSDAVHSASDVLSTFIVMIGVKLAAKESDTAHPYGHERFECVAAIILSVMLVITGAGIGWSGIKKIIGNEEFVQPGVLALVAAVVSIVVKEAMYWYTRAAAKKISSNALMADAWHHRSDALSSIGSFAGILGARLGLPILDPIASVVICLFIFKVGISIFIDASRRMTDTACDKATEARMRVVIAGVEGVQSVDMLQTRLFGNRIYVEVEISASGDMRLSESHDIAEKVHEEIEKEFKDVKHCMVHVNPVE